MTNSEKKELVNNNLDLIAPRVTDATDEVDGALIKLYYQVASQVGDSANGFDIKSLFDAVREDIRITQIETICDVTRVLTTGEEA